MALTLDRTRIAGPEAVGVAGLSRAEHREAAIAGRLTARLDRAEREARERLSAAGIAAHQISRLDGDIAADLPPLALGHDLVVLSNALRRRADSDDLDVDLALNVAELVRAVPRPFLLADRVPLDPAGPVAVAYDGGRPAARALHLACLLGLLDGREVHVLTAAEDPQAAHRTAAAACALPALHGAPTATPHALAPDGDPAAAIAAALATLRPSLLVMGAFGERSLAEWLFGSTTRHLIERAAPALFLSA